jgi:hypothetical protein
MADHPQKPDLNGRPNLGRGRSDSGEAAQLAEALRDERQTERQAPDNANPGEAASG